MPRRRPSASALPEMGIPEADRGEMSLVWTQLAQGGPALSLVRNKMRRVVGGGSRPCTALVTRVSTKNATPLLEEMLDLLPEPPRHVIFLPMTPSASPSTAASQPHKQHLGIFATTPHAGHRRCPGPVCSSTGGCVQADTPPQVSSGRQFYRLLQRRDRESPVATACSLGPALNALGKQRQPQAQGVGPGKEAGLSPRLWWCLGLV